MARPTNATRRGLAEGYRSGLEVDTAEALDKKNAKYEYEEFKIPWEDRKIRKYTPDFLLLKNYIIIETKGRFTSVDRRKHIEIQKQHPDLDIRFVFSNCNAKLYKGSKTTYAEWCEKNGFRYAHKEIPSDWLKEKLNRKSKMAVMKLREGES